MTTINATYISKDQNWNDESTTYWFDVDGETFGVVHSSSVWDGRVVDCDGTPSDKYSPEQFNITQEMIEE